MRCAFIYKSCPLYQYLSTIRIEDLHIAPLIFFQELSCFFSSGTWNLLHIAPSLNGSRVVEMACKCSCSWPNTRVKENMYALSYLLLNKEMFLLRCHRWSLIMGIMLILQLLSLYGSNILKEKKVKDL